MNVSAAFDPTAFRWEGVETRAYKPGAGAVTRHVLAGPAQAAFEVRYFEVAPGGATSLEKHEHVHVVMALRGRGRALIGREVVEMAPFDVVQTPPFAPHRWVNAGDEPFGFLCTVDRERDRPQALTDDELAELAADPRTAPLVRWTSPASGEQVVGPQSAREHGVLGGRRPV